MSKNNLFGANQNENGTPPIVVKFGNHIFIDENVWAKLDGTIISVSTDYGNTYPKSIDVGSKIAKVTFCHIFSNGKMMVGSHTQLAYTSDFITLNYTSVKDINGNTFSPTLLYDNFNVINLTSRQILNGQEVLMWGNYNNGENQNNNTTTYSYIWFTEDFGANVKCIFQFNVSSTFNNGVIKCRHIHNVDFDVSDSSFWITVGDNPESVYSHWVKVLKVGSNFTFDWIGSGMEYKCTNLIFQGEYIYASADFTGGGLQRIKKVDARDITKFENVKMGLNDALFAWVKGNEAIIFVSKYFGTQSGKLYYYSDDLANNTWHTLTGDMPLSFDDNSVYFRFSKPNSRGEFITTPMISYLLLSQNYTITPTLFVNKMLAKAGFPNAFKD